MRNRTLLILFLLGGLVWPVGNQAAPGPVQMEVEAHIEKLYLDQAEALLPQLENPVLQPYYRSKIDFIRCLAQQDPDFLPVFFDRSEKALEELEPLPLDMPLRRVLLAEIHFQTGMIRFLDQSYLSAAGDLQEACDLIHTNYREFPTNTEQLKLLGTYQVALASVPGKFRWLTRLLCFKGELNTGIRQLEQAAAESTLLPKEAEILLFYIDKNLLNQPQKAFGRIQSLHKEAPRVFTWNFFLVSTFLDLHQTDSALTLLEKGNPFSSDPQLCYPAVWDYQHGKAYYYKGDHTHAQFYFSRFLEGHKGESFRADALFRTAISLTLEGQYPKAQKVFQHLAEAENSGLDADEYAVAMAGIYQNRHPSPHEKAHMEARNLYDGGYYLRSLEVLKQTEAISLKRTQDEQTEMAYRQARNHEALGNALQAAQFYESCQQPAATYNRWMQVYALYYLGQIDLQAGRKQTAEQRFRKALQSNGYYYQSGLEQRCKAALALLKDP